MATIEEISKVSDHFKIYEYTNHTPEYVKSSVREHLRSYIRRPFKIVRTPEGKPYIPGNPVYFSVSHSGSRTAVAVTDCPVGIDIELYPSGKPYEHILEHMSSRERADIHGEKDFLIHWTIKEAYIKMVGSTLAQMYRDLEYTGAHGLLYKGNPAWVDITVQIMKDEIRTFCVSSKAIGETVYREEYVL